MKSLVRIFAIILLATALCGVFASCGNKDDKEEPSYADYTVSVVDGIGNPMANVMVKFTDESGETKTKVTGKDGLAVLKNALVGNYDILVEQGFSTAEITRAEYKMDSENRSLRIIVKDTERTQDIFGNIADDSYAYYISAGEHAIPGVKDTVGYYIFRAQTRGVYRFSFTSDDSEMKIAYQGDPLVVQSSHIGDGAYDGKSFELVIQDTATPYVISLSFVSGDDADLKIERVGDTPFDPNYDVKTVNVQMKMEGLDICTLPEGTVLKDFNVLDTSITVELRDDGFYYTSGGDLIYLRLQSVGDYSAYIDKPVATIYDIVGLGGYQMGGVGGSNFGGFVFDENGDYVEKRIYNDMIKSYYELCDNKPGVYPLTEELAEAMKVHGDNAGWFDSENPNTYLFKVPVTEENAWLFLCCTAK